VEVEVVVEVEVEVEVKIGSNHLPLFQVPTLSFLFFI